jgi:hypothetical protein
MVDEIKKQNKPHRETVSNKQQIKICVKSLSDLLHSPSNRQPILCWRFDWGHQNFYFIKRKYFLAEQGNSRRPFNGYCALDPNCGETFDYPV